MAILAEGEVHDESDRVQEEVDLLVVHLGTVLLVLVVAQQHAAGLVACVCDA